MNFRKIIVFTAALISSLASLGQNIRSEQALDVGRYFGLTPRPTTLIPNWAGKTNVWVGDSYVVGVGVANTAYRYTSLVSTWTGATENNLGVSSSVITGAVGNISGCARPLFYASTIPTHVSGTHLFLTFHFGFNDVYNNDGVHSVADSFGYSYRQKLDSAINVKLWAADSIVLDGIPYQRNAQGYVGACGVTTAANAARVKQYNDTIRAIAQAYGCIYHDWAQWQLESGNQDSLVYTDGIHPDTAGYNYIAKQKSNLYNYVPFWDSAVINYLQYIPTMTYAETKALNDFVLREKKAGRWSKIKAAYPIYGKWLQYGSAALVGTNLTNYGCGNFNVGFTNCPGTNFGLDTHVAPADFTNGGITIVEAVLNDISENRNDAGTLQTNPSTAFTVEIRSTGNQMFVRGGGTVATISNGNSAGLYYSVINSSSINVYKAGSNIGGTTGANTFADTKTFYISNAGDGTNPGLKTITFFMLEDPLTSGEVAAQSTSLQTLLTSWGR